MSSSVLECIGLEKHFQDGKHKLVVLHNINLHIERAQQIAIMGRSGSGKSTLLQLLGGLDKPTRGKVILSGQDLAKLSQNECGILRNKQMGFVYQMHHLLPEFTALENIAMPLLIAGENVTIARNRALELLDLVGLTARAKHIPGKLSGGERQRIAIARALVANPACVLADEPTGNLDDENAAQVIEILAKLNKQIGTALVIVTHDESVARQMAQTYYLHLGKLQLKNAK